MKKFQFSLSKAREWRRLCVEQEEEKLQRLFSERESIEAQIRSVEAESARLAEDLTAAPSLFARELIAMDSWRLFLIRRKSALLGSKANCEQRIEKQRIALVEARRQLQLLERLEQRKRSEWQQEFDREQEAIASELHLARMHNRRQH